MSLGQVLKKRADDTIARIARKQSRLIYVTQKFMAAATKGYYYLELEELGCHPEEKRELLQAIREEGIRVDTKTITREQQNFGFGVDHPDDSKTYETVTIYTFSWKN